MLKLNDAEMNAEAQTLRCSWEEDSEVPGESLVKDPLPFGTEGRGQTWKRIKRQEQQDLVPERTGERESRRPLGPGRGDRAVVELVLSKQVSVARPPPCVPHLPNMLWSRGS